MPSCLPDFFSSFEGFDVVTFAPPETFQRRAEFLHLAARGRKFARPGFVLQILRTDSAAPVRVGYTATKKLGNAVVRNRAKRRLREAARLTLAGQALPGVRLVLIGRQETAQLPFAVLCENLQRALRDAL